MTTCPGTYLGEWSDILWWFDRADDGQWPCAGGIIDQSAVFVALYRLWHVECAAVRREGEP